MKLVIELNDTDAFRVAPCEKNGKHNHAICLAAFIKAGLVNGAFKRELEVVQKDFQDAYKSPGVSVTTE